MTATRIVRRLLWVLALFALVAIMFGYMLYFGTSQQVVASLVQGVVSGILVLLVAYFVRQTWLRPVETLFTTEYLDQIANLIADKLRTRDSTKTGIIIEDSWYEINWSHYIGNAHKVTVAASHMDTWVSNTSNLLQDIFDRGGEVTFFLSKPQTAAAYRVAERYPAKTPKRMGAERSAKTAQKLQQIFQASANRNAKLNVFATTIFSMYVLMIIDDEYAGISP